MIGRFTGGHAPQAGAAQVLAFSLAATMALVPLGLSLGYPQEVVVLGGLGLFGVVFALSSSVHSYLVLAYSDGDKVALNVGFYYMANAGGRLVGTLLSGVLYQAAGLVGCLWASFAFAVVTAALSLLLPKPRAAPLMSAMKVDGGSE